MVALSECTQQYCDCVQHALVLAHTLNTACSSVCAYKLTRGGDSNPENKATLYPDKIQHHHRQMGACL